MPLPTKNLDWPPKQLANITPDMRKWSAWYQGSFEALRDAYGGGAAAALPDDQRPGMIRGGVRGAIDRFWWGRPLPVTGAAPRDHLHVPIAADLCQASADLLFAEQPTITATTTTTQDRLTELADDGMYATLAEAAELGAALGSSYLRVTWDKDVRPAAPFLTAVDADGAWPEFRWGMLRAVTFWRIIATEGQKVFRHLERHELDAAGVGIILHGLYEGNLDHLGQAKAITDRPETAVYAKAMTGADGAITTASPGLAVTYIPNQRPQRAWRHDPLGRYLGRSDLDGVEGHMDALDETYASWMRDVRQGKGRLVVPKTMLDDLGPGKGARFDAERELFTTLKAAGGANQDKMSLEQVQFAIRVMEHKLTAQQLVEDVRRTAGYSAQTFGETNDNEGGGDTTATEIRARERRSYMTRDRKLRHWVPGLADALEKLLAVDTALFNGKGAAERPTVKFPDGVQDSQLVLAQTALVMRQAEAASDEVIVELLHPDWEKGQVAAEVAKIQDQRAAAVPDPTGFGNEDPANLGDGAAADDSAGSVQQ